MKTIIDDDSCAVINGDSIEVLRGFTSNSIDAVVTDPPYELGFMGKQWDATGIAYSVELWREVLRVLKPGGHLLAFGGTRTYHRMTCAIEDAGFEVRDSLHWVYGTGFPKSLNLGDGRGTAIKPAHEPIVMARKPLTGTVAANVLEWGTGALNIDGCRIAAPEISEKAFSTGAQSRHVGILNGGKVSAPEPRTTSAGPEGRWPANILFDEAAANELDAQSGTLKSGARTPKGGARKSGSREGGALGDTSSCESSEGGASRFFYVAKPSRKERGAGNNHPTVKPIELMRYLVRLVTPPGGTVLDPFLGSGTTALAALAEGFNVIGIEQSPEYAEIVRARIVGDAK